MKEKYHLSVTEAQIMEKLWRQEEPIRQTQLLAMFNEEGRDWGRQTLNTLLIRLENRGFVKREHRLVRALYNREQFGILIMEEAAQNFYGGKIHSLFAAFAKNRSITVSEAEELQGMISDYVSSNK